MEIKELRADFTGTYSIIVETQKFERDIAVDSGRYEYNIGNNSDLKNVDLRKLVYDKIRITNKWTPEKEETAVNVRIVENSL